MVNFNALHFLYFKKEQRLHSQTIVLCTFLKLQKSVSILTYSGKEFRMRGPRAVKLLSLYYTVL